MARGVKIGYKRFNTPIQGAKQQSRTGEPTVTEISPVVTTVAGASTSEIWLNTTFSFFKPTIIRNIWFSVQHTPVASGISVPAYSELLFNMANAGSFGQPPIAGYQTGKTLYVFKSAQEGIGRIQGVDFYCAPNASVNITATAKGSFALNDTILGYAYFEFQDA